MASEPNERRELEPIPVRCDTCVWWRFQITRLPRTGVNGHCKRYPPTYKEGTIWRDPVTFEADFCGEWQSSTVTLPEAVGRNRSVMMRPIEAKP